MDACRTAIRSGSIDDVVFSDAFEHVHDPAAAFAEAARVLRPDGRLFVTANNKNSLNLRLTRALGHPDFVTNYQHITELAYEDLVAMLDAAHFDVATSRGLFLVPSGGVPGVDEHVRRVIDDDPEIVEVSRELGELVGARHAFVSVVSAVRR
jgi:SAM-dependent methyltransferase